MKKCVKTKILLHAWCFLEEGENEQGHEASKISKLKMKKFDHESLLSVENNSCPSPRKVVEAKDDWVDIRATMDTGVAGHVMPAEMFPRVKLDRTSTTKKFVAAKREKIVDLENAFATEGSSLFLLVYDFAHACGVKKGMGLIRNYVWTHEVEMTMVLMRQQTFLCYCWKVYIRDGETQQ